MADEPALETEDDAKSYNEDEVLKEVQNMVTATANELEEILSDNPELKEKLQKSVEEIRDAVKKHDSKALEGAVLSVVETIHEADNAGKPDKKLEGGSSLVRIGDSKILKELDEAEKQAQQTANIINEIKDSLKILLSKPHMTEEESRELERKNKLLAQQLFEFEERTRQVQYLVAQVDKRAEQFISPRRLQIGYRYDEETLPKVVICSTGENIPKIIICDQPSKNPRNLSPKLRPNVPPPPLPSAPPFHCSSSTPALQGAPVNIIVPQFAKRLSDSYNMQEKLVAENADLEGKRYKLEEDLLDKDKTVENLNRRLNSLTAELKIVVKENTILSEKLAQHTQEEGKKRRKMPRQGQAVCPADVESRLQTYSNTTHVLEKQLGQMENEVRNMQVQLEAVNRERQMLEQQKKALNKYNVSGPTPPRSTCQGPCNPELPGLGSKSDYGKPDQENLREQFTKLQEDLKNKTSEVTSLRDDNERLKDMLKDSEYAKENAERKLFDKMKEIRELSGEKSKIMSSKNQMLEQEQYLSTTRQRLREAEDELDELRSLIQDQTSQLDDYRQKYLQAQQTVEEQRRQIDKMDMEQQRVTDQLTRDHQHLKNHYQEKIAELSPLPDALKALKMKLQETQQLQIYAERNAETLNKELKVQKDKVTYLSNQLDRLKGESQTSLGEKSDLQSKLENVARKSIELKSDNENLKMEVARLDECVQLTEKQMEEKNHEIMLLTQQLDTLREESARQVTRAKERCETIRRSLQTQISDLERQLAQSRATARSALKDRDEIRQRMQSQITELNENFEQAQLRIRGLQGHVNFLKSSYTNMFGQELGEDDPLATNGALLGHENGACCYCPTNPPNPPNST